MATLFFVLTLFPLCFFLFRILLKAKWQHSVLILLVWACCASFLALRPHLDNYSGLDNAAYGTMAEAFRQGDDLVCHDAFFEGVPSNLREFFLYRPTIKQNGVFLRPTRNLAFQLDSFVSQDQAGDAIINVSCDRRPFYLPSFSLAEAGSLMGHRFTPVIASIFAAILFACIMKGCRTKVVSSSLLSFFLSFFVTAFPVWFFRGEYPEVVAISIASSVLLSHIAIPLKKPLSVFFAAFSLVFSVSFHFTALLIAIPILIYLLISQKERSSKIALAFGSVIGFVPSWMITRFVAAPYGDWTRLSTVVGIITGTIEHTVLFIGFAALGLLFMTIMFSSRNMRLRALFRAIDIRLNPYGYIVLSIIPYLLLYCIPSSFSERFHLALPVLIKSLGIPAIIVIGAGCFLTLRERTKRKEHLLMLLILWILLFFMLILGQEGIANRGRVVMPWGLRRFLMPVVMLLSFCAIPISRFISQLKSKKYFVTTSIVILILAIYPMISNRLIYSISYNNGLDYNENAVSNIEKHIESSGNPIIIFDYFRHSTPFSASGHRKVLGIGRHATKDWVKIAAWIGDTMATQKVQIVSSYANPPMLEETFAMRETKRFVFRDKNAKGFPDISVTENKILNTFLEPYPIPLFEPIVQNLSFTGSPIGLRGEWHAVRGDGAWSRQGAGFVAPIPSKGKPVEAFFDFSWFPPSTNLPMQTVAISFLDGVKPIILEAKEGRQTFSTIISLSDSMTNNLTRTGIYTINSMSPYNPATYGIKGYPDDLGLFFHNIRIESK